MGFLNVHMDVTVALAGRDVTVMMLCSDVILVVDAILITVLFEVVVDMVVVVGGSFTTSRCTALCRP